MSKEEQPKGLFDESLKGTFVSERLVNDLRLQIESGALRLGEVVKPVRELMKQYEISYNSVRKALNQLAQEGYLTLEQGRGTFVKGAKVPRSDKSLDHQNIKVVSSVANAPSSAKKDEGVLDKAVVVGDSGEQDGWVDDYEPEGDNESIESIKINKDLETAIPAPRGDIEVITAPDVRLAGGRGVSRALRCFLSEALAAGRSVRLVPVEPERLAAQLGEVSGQGIALWGLPVPEGVLSSWGEAGRACVSVGFWPATGVISAVLPDNFGGGYEMARRMVELGHRQVAFLGARSRNWSPAQPAEAGSDARERLSGCRVAWEEAGVELPRSHVVGASAQDDWLADRLLALRPQPTAVVVSEQDLAEALVGQLKERGIRVPRVMSVGCFGGKDEPNPLGISSMRVDWERAGRCALSRLRELMAGAPVERLRIGLPMSQHEGSTIVDLRSRQIDSL